MMPRSFPRLLLLLPALLLLALSLAPTRAGAAEKTGRIAFLPFATHAAKDMGYLGGAVRDMLASRLAAELNLAVVDKARVDAALAGMEPPAQAEGLTALAGSLEADYLVSGSITALGSALSLDARVFAASQGRSQSFYATAKDESAIIPAIDSLAWDIGEKVFQRPRPATALLQPAAPAAQPAQPSPGQYATPHPERALAGRAGGSPFIYSRGATGVFDFSKSQNMKLSLQFMEMADLDGDGSEEIILADRTSVQIMKRDGARLSKVGQIAGPTGYRIHAISVADLNGNGIPEIYVSAADHQNPNSFAFEWKGADQAEYLFKDARWYVRAMALPGQGTVLLGQRSEVNRAVAPGLFRLEMKNNGVQIAGSLDYPAGINLFDFTVADLDNDGSMEIIAIDQYDRLQVLRSGGSLLWKSDEFFGGTTRFIGGQAAFDAKEMITSDKQDRVYIPSRIIVTDVNNDGVKDIIINKNLSSSSRIFQNMKNYPSGEIHALTWNGIALTELWRTRKIDGYIVDYLLRPKADNSGAELLVGIILGSSAAGIFDDQTSTVLMYQLDYSKTE